MKTNIKMRVRPEQSVKVQEICFKNNFEWIDSGYEIIPTEYIFIESKDIRLTRCNKFFDKHSFCEIDADLFIRTNGTCEEISDEGLSKIKAASEGKSTEYLQEKIINLHKQINKDRATIKNQKEELHKLNIKLQKCISLEQHNKIVDELKKDINFRNETIKNTLQISKDRLKEIEELNKQIDKINKDNVNYLSNNILSRDKEIEKLKAVIEYLESKVNKEDNNKSDKLIWTMSK